MEITNQKSRGPYFWIGIGVGACVLLTVCIIGVMSLSMGGLVWLGSQTPENISSNIDVPLSSEIGEYVELVITVTNIGDSSIDLNSIDFSLNYLDGFDIDYSTPPYDETSQFDALNEKFQSFYFSQSIDPGDSLTVIFYGQAILPGDYSGALDICIDSLANCQTNIVRTLIK